MIHGARRGAQVLLAGNPHRITSASVTLTLLTGFGILDVGYGFRAQGPDSDSQL